MWFKKTANAIGGGLFLTLFIVFVIQVMARFGLNKPLAWTDELAVILYVWIILWAAAFMVPEREHVAFDLLWNSAGPRTRRVMQMVGHLLIGFGQHLFELFSHLPRVHGELDRLDGHDVSPIQAVFGRCRLFGCWLGQARTQSVCGCSFSWFDISGHGVPLAWMASSCSK